MNNRICIETLGVLFKEETLQSLDKTVVQNTLVLESLEPFPGYHGSNEPLDSKPDSVFLVTEKSHPVETIFRIAQHVCRYHTFHFDSCPADIFIHNNHLPCIRIKYLNNYSHISDILGCFVDKGIEFSKHRKINDVGLIRIEKTYFMEQMEDHFYRDLVDENTYYFDLPYHFSWNLFKSATLKVKNNLDNSNFDAALGFIYLKEIRDLVRIYAKIPNLTRLQGMRDKYLDEIRRLQEL